MVTPPLRDPDEDTDARLTLLAWPAGDGTPRLELEGGSLAGFFGFPLGEAASSNDLDAANGDVLDRFRGCNEPCVEGSDGNCDKPAHCLDADRPLLEQVFEGPLRLTTGRPPLREQLNVCMPEQQFETGQDVCAGFDTYDDVPSELRLSGPDFPEDILFSTSPGSFRSRLVRFPDAGESCEAERGEFEIPPTVTAFGGLTPRACVACGPLLPEGPEPGAALPARPRRCNTDADCTLHKSCAEGPCEPEPGDYYCTHLTVDYMGVPAGDGLCARPVRCPGDPATFPGCIERTVFAGSDDFETTIAIKTGTIAEDPNQGDFQPSFPGSSVDPRGTGVECALAGCIGCVGQRDNGYCFDDADCPEMHRCVTPDSPGRARRRTPMCVLRPVLSDGRMTRALDALAELPRPGDPGDGQFQQLRNRLQPLRDIRSSVVGSLGSLVMPHRVVDKNNVRITRLRLDIGGADVRWRAGPTPAEPLRFPASIGPEDFPGTGNLTIGLLTDGDLRVDGRVRLLPGLWTDFEVEVKLSEIRLLLIPSPAGTANDPIHVRALGPLLMDRDGEQLSGDDIRIVEFLGADFPFGALVDVLVSVFAEGIFGSSALGGGLGTGTAAVSEPAGEIVNQLVTDAVFGGLLFGVEDSSLVTTGDGPGLAAAPVLETAVAVPGRAVGLFPAPGEMQMLFRGDRFPIAGLGLLTASPDDLCCALERPDGQAEPSPNCLEARRTVTECLADCP